jgi:hypothetical protein
MDNRIEVRVSGTDAARYSAAALRDGCTNLSDWLRGLADARDAETL